MKRAAFPTQTFSRTLPQGAPSKYSLTLGSRERARTGLTQSFNFEEEQMRMTTVSIGWILALATVFALGTPAYGEEKYSVSGIITFSEGEVVFVSLYTQDRFNDFKNRPLPPEPYTQVIVLSPEERKAGRAKFLFKDIPRGTYGQQARRAGKLKRTGLNFRSLF
jgi:hypothetical protein